MPKTKAPKVTKTKAPKVKSTTPRGASFKVTFGYNGQKEVKKGKDLIKIFSDWSPRVFKTIVTLSVKKGKKEIQRRLPVIQARRIAGNPKFSYIYASQLLKFLG
jgi:hypothetical protein